MSGVKMGDVPTEFIFVSNVPCETYCHSCGQLRLWCKSEKPVMCGNCGAVTIEVDTVGSERFSKLRGLK